VSSLRVYIESDIILFVTLSQRHVKEKRAIAMTLRHDNAEKVQRDDHFCLPIYAAWHTISKSYQKYLQPLDLTYVEYMALVLLWENDHRMVKEFTEAFATKTSTVTPLLKKLEVRGLVIREKDKDDGRSVRISLTNEGRALKRETSDIQACMVHETGLSQAELSDLVSMVVRLKKGLEAAKL
jgi:DNA-binding MarR family transcriptional regulator